MLCIKNLKKTQLDERCRRSFQVQDTWSCQHLIGESYISQPICWAQVETAGLVALLSLAQSVSRGHTGALLQKATQQSAALLHSTSVSTLTGTMGLFRKGTLQGAASAGVEKPT